MMSGSNTSLLLTHFLFIILKLVHEDVDKINVIMLSYLPEMSISSAVYTW